MSKPISMAEARRLALKNMTDAEARRDEFARKEAEAMSDTCPNCERLKVKNARMRDTIRNMQIQAERRNFELDAMHFVWCSGSCESGIHRYHSARLTLGLVEEAERNTARLRQWWESHNDSPESA